MHTSHSVWSAFVLTSWKSTPQVCCRPCGTKAKLGGLASSLVLGWWGVPFGLIITPIQVVRNIVGLASPPDPDTPTDKLSNVVRVHLATHYAKAEPLPDDYWPENSSGNT